MVPAASRSTVPDQIARAGRLCCRQLAQKSAECCDRQLGEKQTFGWIVHPQEPVTGQSLTIRGLTDGTYNVRFYRTWIGEFLDSRTAECRMGEMTITVPQWKTKGGNPRYSDHDIAFLFTRTSSNDE